MSLNGQTQTYIPPTLDGLNVLEADQIFIDGVELDPTNLVTYTGSVKPLNMGAQAIKTTYAPVLNADVVNLLALQNAILYVEGINVANFVKYTGSNSDTDLGTFKISSSAVPSNGINLTNKTYVDTQDALRVPYLGATANLQLGSNTLIANTAQFTAITSATPSLALGVDGSGNLRSFAVPVAPPNFSAVSVGSVPYESAVDIFSNSLLTQGTASLGYSGASFTASTGIASITFASPTYTANSNASVQGIINATAIPAIYLNMPCIATLTNVSFPLFATAPYPYFTLTSGATVVYTSPIGASGTISMPFTPTSTTLFITIFFKSPPTGFSGAVFRWDNFTITTASMITTGGNITTNGTTSIGTLVNSTAGSFGTLSNHPLHFMTQGSTRMVMDTLGRVGLGTTSPTYQLHLYNNATTANQPLLLIESTSTENGYNACLLLKTGTNTSQINTDAAGNLALNANTPGVKWVSVGGDNSSKLSAGSNNPQDFIGYRKFMVAGTSGNAAGGHVAYYTTSDYYPLFQQLNWTHGDIFQGYDFYFDGSFRNATNGTGFAFYKLGNTFNLFYNTGTQGTAAGFNTAIQVSASGSITQPAQPYCMVGSGVDGSRSFNPGDIFGRRTSFFTPYWVVYSSVGVSNTVGSGWVDSVGAFYAPYAGKWQVNVSFYWNSFTGGVRWGMVRYNSGGAFLENRYCALNGAGIAGDTTQSYSTMFVCYAGDYLQITHQGGGAAAGYFGGITHSHATFTYLG